MKSHYIILFLLTFIACNQSKPAESKFTEKNIITIYGDTIYNHYKNGVVKEKGVYSRSLKKGVVVLL